MSKIEQIEHLLTNSIMDYLCLSETWLCTTTLTSVKSVGVTITLFPEISF